MSDRTEQIAEHNEHKQESSLELSAPEPAYDSNAQWHVLWTRSNFEKRVEEQLTKKGYEVFLPEVNLWCNKRKALATASTPMFRSYLFVHAEIDKETYIDISNAKGLVSILGHSWDRLGTVPEHEIDSIKLAVSSELPTMPYPYIKQGSRVKVIRGSLKGAEGHLVKKEQSKGLFVLSVELLHRSVAVEVDCTDVVPV